jgi:hypothetical protein
VLCESYSLFCIEGNAKSAEFRSVVEGIHHKWLIVVEVDK